MHSNVVHYKDAFIEDNRLPVFDSASLKINQPGIDPSEQFQILLRFNKVWAGSLFINHTVFKKVGRYDENVRFWEDRPMLLKITFAGIKLHYFDFFSAKYRVHWESIQRRKTNKELFSQFIVEKEIYYKKNYLKHLPLIERTVRYYLLNRVILLHKITGNRRNLLTLLLLKISGFPWSKIASVLSKKYK